VARRPQPSQSVPSRAAEHGEKRRCAERISEDLTPAGYVRKGHLSLATRDDLVGQVLGTPPRKRSEILKRGVAACCSSTSLIPLRPEK